MKPFQYYSKIFLCAASVAMLTACGGATDEQDTPKTPTDTRINVSGLAMNGYLANALVWVDARENNMLDGFEPFAYTDNEGYFSYNPNTGTNYCADENPSLQRFCLQLPTQRGEIVLKAAKGLELLSGEAFRAVLSTRIDAQQAKQNFDTLLDLGARPLGSTAMWQMQLDAAQTKLSPLSSIAHYLPQDTALASILIYLGFDVPADMSNEDILAKEYIAGIVLDDEISDDLFVAAVTLSRLVDTLVVNLDKAADSASFGENGLPISSADAIYQTLAQNLAVQASAASDVNNPSARSNTKANTTQAARELTYTRDLAANAIAHLVEVLNDNDANNLAVLNGLNRLAQSTALSLQLHNILNISAAHFNNINPVNDRLSQLLTFNQLLTLPTLSSPIGFMSEQDAIAVNVLAAFLQDPNNHISELLSNATEEFVNERNANSALTLSIDLNTLTQQLLNIAKGPSGESALAANDAEVTLTKLANLQTVDDGSFWTGKHLSLSGLQDGSEQGQVVMFFNGDSKAVNGDMVMCIAYKNDDDPSDNITNQRFDGTWSVLGGASQNRLSLVSQGFNIQMKVLAETLGADIPIDQQIESLPRMANESYGRYGFTLNEDTATWYSDDASVNQSYGLITSTQNIPANDLECANLLTLQVN